MKANLQNSQHRSNPLIALREMHAEHIRKKHPNFPVKAIPVRKYTDKTANGLTACIIDFLTLSGWQAERISNTGRPIDNTQVVQDVLGNKKQIGSLQWIPGTGTKGTSDISAIVAGRSVKIEVKIGRDQQSEHQKQYQQRVEKSGGLYFIARSYPSFLQWYNDTFNNGAYNFTKTN